MPNEQRTRQAQDCKKKKKKKKKKKRYRSSV
jgi:hypothetical protein